MLGFFLAVVGIPGAIRPHRVARVEEQLDAIGSERSWSAVDPADWTVVLTRTSGVTVALVGTAMLAAGDGRVWA